MLVDADHMEECGHQAVDIAELDHTTLRLLGRDPVEQGAGGREIDPDELGAGDHHHIGAVGPGFQLVQGSRGVTLDLAGQAKFGPDVQWVQDLEDFSVDPERAASFYSEVRKYWPGLPDGALQPAYAGIRPKINAPTEAAADFCIQGPANHGVAGLVNRRMNLNLSSPWAKQQIQRVTRAADLLANVAEELDR